jgi:hypothetical protein
VSALPPADLFFSKRFQFSFLKTKIMCRQLFIAALIIIAMSAHSHAQCLGSCCSCSGSQSNDAPLKKGQWLMGVSFQTMRFHPFTEAELLALATPDDAVYSVDALYSVKAMATVGITRRFSVTAFVPYNFSIHNNHAHVHSDDIAYIHNEGNINGWGDASLLINYLLLNKNNWNISASAGMKMPTGQTSAYSSDSIVLSPHLQPATGSWDPLAQLSVSKTIDRWKLATSAFAHFTTTGLEHNMGDYFRCDATAAFELMKHAGKTIHSVQLSAGVAGDHNEMMRVSGYHVHDVSTTVVATSSALVTDHNSGFTRLMAEGGVRCAIGKSIVVPVQLFVPVINEVKGNQVTMEWNAVASILYSFH